MDITDMHTREQRRQEITRLSHAGHDLPTFFREMARLLRKAIPFDAACLHTLDPATLLETSHIVVDLPFENPRAAELEYLHEDFNQFATSPAPDDGVASSATPRVGPRSAAGAIES